MNRKFTSKVLILSLIILIPFPALSQEHTKKEKEIINIIMKQTGLNKNSSWNLYIFINSFSEKLQSHISYVAKSKDSHEIKLAHINNIIKYYFKSEESQIEVSNLHKKTIKTYGIKDYLLELGSLNRTRYTDVKLEFLPNYLGIGRIEKLRDGNYEVSISMDQTFEGYHEGTLKYSDRTRKKVRLALIWKEDIKAWIPAVDEISVRETTYYTP